MITRPYHSVIALTALLLSAIPYCCLGVSFIQLALHLRLRMRYIWWEDEAREGTLGSIGRVPFLTAL